MELYTYIRYFFAVLATLILSPGVGHFFIGRVKKAFFLIGLTLSLVLIMAFIIASSSDLSATPREYAAMRNYIDAFLLKDSPQITLMYVLRAALLSYSIADIVFAFISDIKNKGGQSENK